MTEVCQISGSPGEAFNADPGEALEPFPASLRSAGLLVTI